MFVDGKLLLLFILLQSLVVGVLCNCKCRRDHPQQIFCDNEFVLKAHLDKYRNGDYGFTMEIIEIFKGDVKKLNITNGSVDLIMDYLCGIEMMEIGEPYIIFGHSRNGEIYVCPGIRGNQPWLDTSDVYQRGLSELYQSGCHCPNKSFRKIIQGGCIPRFTYLSDECVFIRTEDFWDCIRFKYPHYISITPYYHYQF